MLIPWPNSEYTNRYDPPIWYLWTLTRSNSFFQSWLPTGYLLAWLFNISLFFIEWIAWLVGGKFYLLWATVCLWGGLTLGAFPWVAEMAYIWSEWPAKQSGSSWKFVFWSGEFIMLFFQGCLWLLSFIIHLIYLPGLEKQVLAAEALKLGLTNECQCDPCELPEDEVERAQAEAICKAACNQKCPPEAPPCPLKQFEDESLEDYARRCKAAAQLAQAAAEREETEAIAATATEEFEDEETTEPIDDISSPEDEW